MMDANGEGRAASGGTDGATSDAVDATTNGGEPITVSRRNALKILGAVPVGAAIGATSAGVAIAAAVAPLDAAMTPVAQAAAPKFFSVHEWRTVRLLVDYILPRDERSGSATEAKVPEYIDFLLAEKDASVNTQIAMRGGLAWVDAECRKRFRTTFAGARDAQRRQVLDDIAYPEKAKPEMRYGVTFFNRLRDMTASGFFSSAMGWRDLRYTGGVANPGYDGCPPPVLEKLGVSYDVMQGRVSPDER